ncbi:hypothetical protein HL657_01890 [Methanoculleus sp. YWC-01]|uniref:Uncharacterized protein n=1 Tax=Methanoculleus nereidis TaxID=2735141 RepID=A0ABU3Z035_9EURY|nr:hypothetical protein [Methanoculleus sp. YWC-01]
MSASRNSETPSFSPDGQTIAVAPPMR